MKLPPREARPRPEPHFPGYQAGASLKQDVERLRVCPKLETSPVTKPGPH